jgi:hypothetical protein
MGEAACSIVGLETFLIDNLSKECSQAKSLLSRPREASRRRRLALTTDKGLATGQKKVFGR